jgi:hypothetical protein
MVFGKCLGNDQLVIICLDVTIANDNKLQFYLEEIYNSNRFDKQEMLMWGATANSHKNRLQPYKGALQNNCQGHQHLQAKHRWRHGRMQPIQVCQPVANYGNEIREYIQQLASTSAANTTNTASNVQTKDKLKTMEVEIKKLTATIALMARKFNSENINPNDGDSIGSNCKNRCPQMKKFLNMVILSDSTITAPPVAGRNLSTKVKPHGQTNSAATCFSPQPSM